MFRQSFNHVFCSTSNHQLGVQANLFGQLDIKNIDFQCIDGVTHGRVLRNRWRAEGQGQLNI